MDAQQQKLSLKQGYHRSDLRGRDILLTKKLCRSRAAVLFRENITIQKKKQSQTGTRGQVIRMTELERAIQWLEDHIKWYGHEQEIANHCRVLLDALRWVPVSEQLPKSGEHVLLCCEVRPSKNRYVCDGFYAKSKSEEVGWSCEGAAEYDEDTDEYYLPEGFYEVVKNWDEWSSLVIPDYVTHWRPLPEAPKEG